LGLGTGDTELLPDDPIEERGLAGVRLADDGDEAGAEGGVEDQGSGFRVQGSGVG